MASPEVGHRPALSRIENAQPPSSTRGFADMSRAWARSLIRNQTDVQRLEGNQFTGRVRQWRSGVVPRVVVSGQIE